MKKTAFFLLASLVLTACSDEKDNSTDTQNEPVEQQEKAELTFEEQKQLIVEKNGKENPLNWQPVNTTAQLYNPNPTVTNRNAEPATFDFTLKEYATLTKYEDLYLGLQTPGDGNIYVVLHIEATNTGKETSSVTIGDGLLVSSSGYAFPEAGGASAWVPTVYGFNDEYSYDMKEYEFAPLETKKRLVVYIIKEEMWNEESFTYIQRHGNDEDILQLPVK